MMRLRIHFSKTEAMRFTGHLDLHSTWERAFRRSGLPLAYSQGFHPQPRFSLAAALPLGYTSQAELADAWLEQEMALSEVQSALERALPPGIGLNGLSTAGLHAPALQTQVRSAVYLVTFLDPIPDLIERLATVLAAETLVRERRGKTYDLRPLIEGARWLPPDDEGHARLDLQLAARESATGRPDEVLGALQLGPETARVHRTQLIFAD